MDEVERARRLLKRMNQDHRFDLQLDGGGE